VKVRRPSTPGEAEATPRLLQILPAVASGGPDPDPRTGGLVRGHLELRPGPTGAYTPAAGPGLTRRAATVLSCQRSRTGTVGANSSTGHRHLVQGLARVDASGRGGDREPGSGPVVVKDANHGTGPVGVQVAFQAKPQPPNQVDRAEVAAVHAVGDPGQPQPVEGITDQRPAGFGGIAVTPVRPAKGVGQLHLKAVIARLGVMLPDDPLELPRFRGHVGYAAGAGDGRWCS
jgi:hypothetical protein